MKPETKARAVVSLLISLVAFTMASGVGAFLGLGNTTTELPDLNLTQQGDLPTIWNSNNASPAVATNNTATSSQQPQEEVYQEPPSTGTGSNNNQSSNQTN
jgi:hypothetical protein